MFAKMIGCSVVAMVLFIVLIVVISVPNSSHPASPTVSTDTAVSTQFSQSPKPIDSHEQRLADLQSKRESIAGSLQIEMEMGRKLANDAENLSRQPIRDPNKREWLMDKMDQQQKRIDDLGHQLQEIDAQIAQEKSDQAPEPSSQTSLLTALQGNLAQRREYDLRMIRTTARILNAEDYAAKTLSYCMFTVHEAERLSGPAPELEYRLQPDGTVAITSGKPAPTPEQRYRDGERMSFELLNGGGPIVQDCAGSLLWFHTWHNKPMPADEAFSAISAKAQTDMEEVDKTLDSRLVDALPKP